MAKKPQSMSARHATPKKSNRKKPRQVLRPGQQFDPRALYREDEDLKTPVSSPMAARSNRLRSTIQVLSSDYHYVVDDLKRIAITAGILVVAMIVLTFVIK